MARFGGEEFIVVLPETTAQDAERVAEKLRRILTEVKVAGLQGGFFTASFGIATYPRSGTSGHELLRVADAALYRAKEGGRNRVEGPSSPSPPGDSQAAASRSEPELVTTGA